MANGQSNQSVTRRIRPRRFIYFQVEGRNTNAPPGTRPHSEGSRKPPEIFRTPFSRTNPIAGKNERQNASRQEEMSSGEIFSRRNCKPGGFHAALHSGWIFGGWKSSPLKKEYSDIRWWQSHKTEKKNASKYCKASKSEPKIPIPIRIDDFPRLLS